MAGHRDIPGLQGPCAPQILTALKPFDSHLKPNSKKDSLHRGSPYYGYLLRIHRSQQHRSQQHPEKHDKVGTQVSLPRPAAHEGRRNPGEPWKVPKRRPSVYYWGQAKGLHMGATCSPLQTHAKEVSGLSQNSVHLNVTCRTLS